MRGAFNQVGPTVHAAGSAELCQPWRQGPSTAGASRAGHTLPFHEAPSVHTAQLGLILCGKKTNVFHVCQQGKVGPEPPQGAGGLSARAAPHFWHKNGGEKAGRKLELCSWCCPVSSLGVGFEVWFLSWESIE